MTLDQFVIDLCGIVTEIANSLASILTGKAILDGVDLLLEALSFSLLAADIALHWTQEGVCLASEIA